MSFLNPTPVPVRHYSSTDTDAPQLPANNWTGAIKTILKACLVTGYGGKPGAGWTLREETPHKAIFAMGDPACPPVELEVDSGNINITQLDLHWQGVKQEVGTSWSGSQFNRGYTAWIGWHLVASARGFVLLPTARAAGGGPVGAAMLYFGQICTNLIDPGRQDFVLWIGRDNATGPSLSDVGRSLASGNSKYLYSSGALKIGGKIGDARNTIARTAMLSGSYGGPRQPASNPLGAIAYGEIWLHQSTTANINSITGRLPGLLVASHRTVTEQTGDIIQVAGSPHRWLLTHQDDALRTDNSSNGCALLIDIDEWVY